MSLNSWIMLKRGMWIIYLYIYFLQLNKSLVAKHLRNALQINHSSAIFGAINKTLSHLLFNYF